MRQPATGKNKPARQGEDAGNQAPTILAELEGMGKEIRQLGEQLARVTDQLQKMAETQKVILSCAILPDEVKSAIGEKELLNLVQGLLRQLG